MITQVPTTATHLSGLVSPFTTLDGVRQWLGGTSPTSCRAWAITARCTG